MRVETSRSLTKAIFPVLFEAKLTVLALIGTVAHSAFGRAGNHKQTLDKGVGAKAHGQVQGSSIHMKKWSHVHVVKERINKVHLKPAAEPVLSTAMRPSILSDTRGTCVFGKHRPQGLCSSEPAVRSRMCV